MAESGNQWNTAGALSTLAQSGPSLALYNSLLLLSAPEAREAFNQLSGEVYPSMQSNLIAGSTQLFNVLNQRMLRLFDNDSLPDTAVGDVAGANGAGAKQRRLGANLQFLGQKTAATATWASWMAQHLALPVGRGSQAGGP